MNQSQNSTLLKNESIFPNLRKIGWNSFFHNQLADSYEPAGLARIIGVGKNIYLARTAEENMHVSSSGSLQWQTELYPPVVGDWVVLKEKVVTAILERKNSLSRRAAGGRSRRDGGMGGGEQVIAANLDFVLIVCGLDRDYNPRRVERYLTMVYNCGIAPVIVLTKADLHATPERFQREIESVAPQVPVHLIGAGDEAAISCLRNSLDTGKTAALLGSSGAGKSTLINRLYGENIRNTGSVGDRVGKGRHTTTSRDLIVLPSGGLVIDNPGLREIALVPESGETDSAFPDIDEFARLCRFADCSHDHEPGCRVAEAIACGQLSSERLQNYMKLKRELTYYRQREKGNAAKVERERWKDVSKKVKVIKKKRK